jgi:hypothetical protein
VEIPELDPLSKESSHRVACFFPEATPTKEAPADESETSSPDEA